LREKPSTLILEPIRTVREFISLSESLAFFILVLCSALTAYIDRFCVSVAPFNTAAATKRLRDLGATVEDAELSGELSFSDPDGIRLQAVARSA